MGKNEILPLGRSVLGKKTKKNILRSGQSCVY